jgi:hypothetical protein
MTGNEGINREAKMLSSTNNFRMSISFFDRLKKFLEGLDPRNLVQQTAHNASSKSVMDRCVHMTKAVYLHQPICS